LFIAANAIIGLLIWKTVALLLRGTLLPTPTVPAASAPVRATETA